MFEYQNDAPKKPLSVLLFPVSVWFSAICLEEHYAVDIIGGVVYATVAFVLAKKLAPTLLYRMRAKRNSQESVFVTSREDALLQSSDNSSIIHRNTVVRHRDCQSL